MSWKVTTIEFDDAVYNKTTSNSTAQGYTEEGDDIEHTTNHQVAYEDVEIDGSKKNTVRYGNTQYLVFYPMMNSQKKIYNSTNDTYELDYVDSYLSKLTFTEKINGANGATTYFDINYYLDSAKQQQIDFRNFTVKNSSAANITPYDSTYDTYSILADKTHGGHSETEFIFTNLTNAKLRARNVWESGFEPKAV